MTLLVGISFREGITHDGAAAVAGRDDHVARAVFAGVDHRIACVGGNIGIRTLCFDLQKVLALRRRRG